MINYDDNDENLLSFYNISTVNPSTRKDLNLTNQEQIDSDELNNLTTDEQFNLLITLVNTNTGHNNNSLYRYDDEDPEDPLRGRGTNVIRQLIQKEVISSKDDPKLNLFLISSPNFDSQRFLTTVHQDSSIDELVQSLNFLERNIHSQTAELKLVIDSNFIKFVDCKKSIDDILVGFRQLKTKVQQDRENSTVFNPQRHKNMGKSESLSSEIEESLKNINMASTLLIRPIMENKSKEQKLNTLIEFIKSNKFFFDLPHNLIESLSTQNNDQFIDDYNRFLKEKQEFIQRQEETYRKDIAQLNPDTDYEAIKEREQNQQLVDTAILRVFTEVDNIIAEYRKKIYNELLSLDHEAGNSKGHFPSTNNARFISLVDKLYQLNNDDGNNTSNPIYEFLNTQLSGLRKDLDYQINKFDTKFKMMQRKLLDYISSLADHREGGSHVGHISEKYSNIDDFFRASSTSSTPSNEEMDRIIIKFFDSSDNLDLSFINETWLVLLNFVTYLDDLFLKNMTKFVNNYNHYSNPDNGFNIDTQGKIRNSFVGLVVHVTNKLTSLFDDNAEPVNQLESSPGNYSRFLPYHTNSLSTIFYLSGISAKINHTLTKVGSCMAIVGNANKTTDTNKIIKSLRATSSTINQKILEATCAVWVNDCSQFYDIENWEIYHPIHDKGSGPTFTKAMNVLEYYEGYFLRKLSDLLFIKGFEDNSNDDIRIVASYPSKRILVSVEIQFMRSLNVLIDSLMKKYNVEKSTVRVNAKGANIDSELFKVLTMNNFDRISETIYPKLIKKFDKLFEKNLLQQNLKLYADIDKAALTIFDDILEREKSWIDERVSRYFLKIPNKAIDTKGKFELKVESFTYEVLIHFVKLIHEVKPLTGTEVFVSIMNELQNYFLKLVLEYLRPLNRNDHFYSILGNLKLGIIFFVEVFEPSKYAKLNDYCMNLVEIILGIINENEKPNYSEAEFDNVLMKCLRDSESEFDCFL